MRFQSFFQIILVKCVDHDAKFVVVASREVSKKLLHHEASLGG